MALFSPPRSRPKLSLPQPTLAAGQPFVMPQVIDRPVNLVDDEGNVHGRMGENPNGPELVSIRPPPGPTGDPAGGPDYASGGDLLIGSTPQPAEAGYNPYPNTIGTGIFSGNWVPPVAPQMITPGWYTNPATPDPNAEIQRLSQQNLGARRSLLGSTRAVLDARARTMPIRSAIRNSRSAYQSAQERQNQMQRGVIQQTQADDATRLGELQAIYGASKNIPDLTNAAQAQNLYRAEDRRAAAMGVAPPAEINLPPEGNPARIAGIRPKIMTQEERLTEKAGYEDPIRAKQLELARDAVALQATDVTSARLAAENAGLSLDEANDLVNQAELAQSYSRLFEDETQLDLAEAQQPPFPGAVRYTDPTTGQGQWVTPQERDQLNAQYQENVVKPYNTGLDTRGIPTNMAGLTIPQILNRLPKNGDLNVWLSQPIVEAVAQKLQNLYGYSAEQAAYAAFELIKQEMASRRGSSGGFTELGSSQAPAAAPTGVPNLTGPTLPPGYTP